MPEPTIIKLAHRGIDYFQKMIEQKIPFSLPRYGDGEFSSILGLPGQNCDGIKYTPELRDCLVETLVYPHLQENYYYGLLAIAFKWFRPYIEIFVTKNDLDMVWTEATFLVAANRSGKFASFLQTLRRRPILYVGPTYLQRAAEVLRLRVSHYIHIPEKTAFEDRENIRNKVLVYADKADFVGFSAGPATKWLIWALFPDIGDTHTLFDFGSVFDGYVGRPSRKYQRRATWADIAEANLR